MKTSRFSETQIVAILKQADAGIKVKDLWREHGISDATYYNWKEKCGGLEASDLKCRKETEGELSKLKSMYADLALENRALKDLLEKKLERRLRDVRRYRPCKKRMRSRSSEGVPCSSSLGRRIAKRQLIGRSVIRKLLMP